MAHPTIAPYGAWQSPITAEMIAAGTTLLRDAGFDGEDIYWIEVRAQEGGRYALVRRSKDGVTADVTPPPYNARTRVHEYGGHAYLVDNGTVFFSNFADQRLYRLDPGGAPRPITPEAALRYADTIADRGRGLLFCVREDHRLAGEAVNTLVKVKIDGDERGGEVIVSGNDFYSAPRLSPDGSRLAWLTWNHPNLPWDGTELWVGRLNPDGTIAGAERVAGGAEESIFQPEWSPEGELYFVSDRTDWWNLYRWRNGNIEALCPMEAEFGRPQWVFGMSSYVFESEGRILCTYTQRGAWHLASLDTRSLKLERIATPYTFMREVRAAPGRALLLAGSPSETLSLVLLVPDTRERQVLARSSTLEIDPGYISIPQEVEFPTEGGKTAYAFYYPPRNKDYAAPQGEKPPLIVISHGGPTGATPLVLDEEILYWTSRGIGVLDVNYGGSTGYGRPYRQRLNGQWGVVDVDDCANGARYLARRGDADGERLIIRGGSAGGYTTLCALTFRDVFKAGASHFGIGDLETFAQDTHKFESRYLDSLVGPYPERGDLYVERSAIHFTERLSCPLILFQGAEDKIVPPNQARTMYAAVKAKGLPVAYLEFEGEQHGFLRAENVRRALEAELYFYARVFGFKLAEAIEPVEIDNL